MKKKKKLQVPVHFWSEGPGNLLERLHSRLYYQDGLDEIVSEGIAVIG